MSDPIRILILEDSSADAEFIEDALRRGGIQFTAQRVQTEATFRAALAAMEPHVVLTDYNVPGFRGDAALAIVRAISPEQAVIFVSGTIGEELAVDLMKGGATDYVLKDRLERLPFAIRRALDETEQRVRRHRAEEAARHSSETLSIALEAAQMGTWDWNIATGELEWSDRCKAIFGIPAGDPMHYGRFLRTLHPEDRSRADAAITHALAAKVPYDLEFRSVWPDGSIHWIAAKGRAFYDGTTGYASRMAGAAMDITERKHAEEERQRVEKKLLETQKLESLGVLAGGIAHDFNNLLTGVLGNASLARKDAPANSPMLHYLERIEKAATRAADLCKQMLAYAGKGQFVVQDIDLNALVRETTQMMESSLSKGVTLQSNLADDLPCVNADGTQLRQIVMNLVINASEAIGAKGGTVTITTRLTHPDRSFFADTLAAPEKPEGDYVLLEVSDTGSGMTPATRARIFDPFFTTKFTGRGLGLAAVLGIVRAHQGVLKVSSEPEKGTTFQILLPSTRKRAKPLPAPSGKPEHWRGSGIVLVVDDEAMVRAIAERMLVSMGFEVIIAEDGLKAVECFRAGAEDIRLVILDLTMPRLDGEGAFRELRKIRPDVRVLLMSGFNEEEAMGRFIGQGVAGFLQKPFTTESLRAHLKAILG